MLRARTLPCRLANGSRGELSGVDAAAANQLGVALVLSLLILLSRRP